MRALGQEEAIVWGTAWGSRVALVFATKMTSWCAGCILADLSLGNSVTPEWAACQKMSYQLAKEKISRTRLVIATLFPPLYCSLFNGWPFGLGGTKAGQEW
jgi:hypothetical protein